MKIINLIKYAILGIIQGLTEPLPISSSGHILIFKELFNTNMFNDLNFETIVNFGSFLAILFIFRNDIIKLVKSFFTYVFKKEKRKLNYNDFKYCLLVIIGTIPVGIAGLLFKDKVENLMSVRAVGVALLFTALMLFIVRNMKGDKEDKDITYKDAIIIGLIQMITILPGISRSGTVLVGSLLCHFKRETALKYTFMLYFPVSLAAMALGVTDLISSNNLNTVLIPYVIGMIFSIIVTYFAYQWLSNIVKKGKLWKFSIYCIIVGLFVIFYFR